MLSSFCERELTRIKNEGLYRQRKTIDGAQGASVRLHDKEVLNFCSNDYLGLANDSRLIDTLKKAAERYGVGSGASQLVCGRSNVLAELEELVADYTGREKALVFSSGYLANLAIMTVLATNKNDLLLQDKLNHASSIDGALLGRGKLKRYRHVDLNSLSEQLDFPAENKLVSTESVFSMDGDIAPLKNIAALCRKKNANLVIDDAHGFGILGKTGAGALEHFNLKQEEAPLIMATFGKAAGGSGAFVAGKEALVETLVQKARSFIYSTALPPAIAAANKEAIRLMESGSAQREKLFSLIEHFKQGARDLSLPLKESNTPIQPLIIGGAETAVSFSNLLLQRGILVGATRPPTVPRNTSRLRITLSAGHSAEQVDRLLDCLSLAWKQLMGSGKHAV